MLIVRMEPPGYDTDAELTEGEGESSEANPANRTKLASQRKCDPKLISTPNTHGLEPSVSDLVGGEAFAVDASIIVADAHIAQGHSVAATLHARIESL